MGTRIFTDNDVSKDIDAICSKCGETRHVIVAVMNGKIAKVMCNSCHATHNYKPVAKDRVTITRDTKSSVSASSSSASPTTPRKTTARTSSSSSSAPKRAAEPKHLVPKVPANDRPIRNYSLKESGFILGDRIEHAKYGLGIVDELPAPNKMYVTFESTRVLLVYGK